MPEKHEYTEEEYTFLRRTALTLQEFCDLFDVPRDQFIDDLKPMMHEDIDEF